MFDKTSDLYNNKLHIFLISRNLDSYLKFHIGCMNYELFDSIYCQTLYLIWIIAIHIVNYGHNKLYQLYTINIFYSTFIHYLYLHNILKYMYAL